MLHATSGFISSYKPHTGRVMIPDVHSGCGNRHAADKILQNKSHQSSLSRRRCDWTSSNCHPEVFRLPLCLRYGKLTHWKLKVLGHYGNHFSKSKLNFKPLFWKHMYSRKCKCSWNLKAPGVPNIFVHRHDAVLTVAWLMLKMSLPVPYVVRVINTKKTLFL